MKPITPSRHDNVRTLLAEEVSEKDYRMLLLRDYHVAFSLMIALLETLEMDVTVREEIQRLFRQIGWRGG